jgi:hypothetical protein
MNDFFKFGIGNNKLSSQTLTFSKSSGLTCPAANKCKAIAMMNDQGKRSIKRFKDTEFTCYSATLEALYPSLYNLTRHNTSLLNEYIKKDNFNGLVDCFNYSINQKRTKNCNLVRWNQSGDIYTRFELEALKQVCKLNKDLIFYFYSKNLILYPTNRSIPENMFITASYGGKYDYLIDRGYFKRFSKVVFSEAEARLLNLPIDNDDSHAYMDKGKNGFALLLHGTQEKNSKASEALKEIRKNKKLVSV